MGACGMNHLDAGYRELEHTADWQLQVWAPDLNGLLVQAARGMYSLSGTKLGMEPRVQIHLRFPVHEPERLLVAFLSELLWLAENQGLGFDDFGFVWGTNDLEVIIAGAPIDGQTKEIKAVTYHNLVVRQTATGFSASIVFDV